MNKKTILLGLLSILILSLPVRAVNLVDKIWDGSAFTYKHTVRANNALEIDTRKNTLSSGGNVIDNGTLLLGNKYFVTANGLSLSITDNGAGGLAVGDTIKLVIGDGITLGSAAGAKLTISSDNGHKLNAATSPYTANGTTIQEIDVTYVGTTTGYRVSVKNSEI